jgi:hypothetical protein
VWKISKQSARKVDEREKNVEPTSNSSNPVKGKEREWRYVSWNWSFFRFQNSQQQAKFYFSRC